MGAWDDGCERRSETRRGVVTQFETTASCRKNHYGLPTGASEGSAPNVTRGFPSVDVQPQNVVGGVKRRPF